MEIRHEPAGQRFIAETPGGTATLSYQLREGNVDLYSTFVPPAARGQGVAANLVAAAIAWARAEGYRVTPSCSYVAAWLRAHPDQSDLLQR